MKCTSCNKGKLVNHFLEPFLPTKRCSNCKGNFLYLQDYLKWKEQSSIRDEVGDFEIEATESNRALLCPESGNLMIKYRIAASTEHRLDLSPSRNAIWLDHGEWELLKNSGLSLKLNEIFTDVWQRKVREAKTTDMLEELYQKQFEENFEQIKAMRSIVQSSNHKAEIIAYLISDDPYRV